MESSNPEEEVIELPDDAGVSEMSKIAMTVPWEEGGLDDFGDLHEALKSGKTQKFSADEQNPESGSEEDQGSESEEEEPEVEPSPDDHGPRFLWSAQHGNLDELSRLLAVSQDLINFKDEDGYTALHRASYSHQAAAVLFLLKNGADIHSTTEEDWNPLHSACRWNAFNCVEILLAWGANVNAITHGGQTPLHLAAFCGKSRESIQLLLMHPHVMVNTRNCQQDTPKDIAKRNNNSVDLFDLLESHFRDL